MLSSNFYFSTFLYFYFFVFFSFLLLGKRNFFYVPVVAIVAPREKLQKLYSPPTANGPARDQVDRTAPSFFRNLRFGASDVDMTRFARGDQYLNISALSHHFFPRSKI